jgi:hypothetical protein
LISLFCFAIISEPHFDVGVTDERISRIGKAQIGGIA